MKQSVILILIIGLLLTCQSTENKKYITLLSEVTVQYLPLNGALSQPNAEISGMTWYKEWLILLPQYPDKFQSQIFYIKKNEVINSIKTVNSLPLTPKPILLEGLSQYENLDGYQGLEAICFSGDKIFLTAEIKNNGSCNGLLIKGQINSDRKTIKIFNDNCSNIQSQSNLPNFGEESIICLEDTIISIHEANGLNVNPYPIAHQFSCTLQHLNPLNMPNIDYRITDASMLDKNRRFWVMNYFWPGEKNKFGKIVDSSFIKYGIGKTHADNETVERLIEMEIISNKIRMTNRPPIYLELDTVLSSRNWEGLARLDDLGFLLVTDQFPGSLLGFVPFPEN